MKSRSFTSIAILSLAIGIGGNTAIFSVVHAVLLRPLPYPDAHRIVRLTAYNPLMEIDSSNVSGPDFESWRTDSHAFEALAAFNSFSTSFRGDAEAERVESVAAIRGAVSSADPTQTVYAVKTLEDVFAQSVAPQRLNATLIGLFAAMGLVLAAIGVYAVVAHAVGRRRHEMGVRLALGARPADVFALIVRQGLITVAVGVVLGLGASVAAGRALSGLLYGVEPSDPATLAGSAATLAVIAAAAAALPARRATRVDQ